MRLAARLGRIRAASVALVSAILLGACDIFFQPDPIECIPVDPMRVRMGDTILVYSAKNNLDPTGEGYWSTVVTEETPNQVTHSRWDHYVKPNGEEYEKKFYCQSLTGADHVNADAIVMVNRLMLHEPKDEGLYYPTYSGMDAFLTPVDVDKARAGTVDPRDKQLLERLFANPDRYQMGCRRTVTARCTVVVKVSRDIELGISLYNSALYEPPEGVVADPTKYVEDRVLVSEWEGLVERMEALVREHIEFEEL